MLVLRNLNKMYLDIHSKRIWLTNFYYMVKKKKVISKHSNQFCFQLHQPSLNKLPHKVVTTPLRQALWYSQSFLTLVQSSAMSHLSGIVLTKLNRNSLFLSQTEHDETVYYTFTVWFCFSARRIKQCCFSCSLGNKQRS